MATFQVNDHPISAPNDDQSKYAAGNTSPHEVTSDMKQMFRKSWRNIGQYSPVAARFKGRKLATLPKECAINYINTCLSPRRTAIRTLCVSPKRVALQKDFTSEGISAPSLNTVWCIQSVNTIHVLPRRLCTLLSSRACAARVPNNDAHSNDYHVNNDSPETQETKQSMRLGNMYDYEWGTTVCTHVIAQYYRIVYAYSRMQGKTELRY